MDIAFVLDPLAALKPYKDSSIAMMRAATARGHGVYALHPEDLSWRAGRVFARVRRLEIALHVDKPWYVVADADECELSRFDAVLMRKDPPFDMEYVYTTYLLEIAEAHGARVYNRPASLRNFNEKLSIARFAQFTAPTLVTRDQTSIRAFLTEHGEIVVKPLDGMGGSSVFRLGRHDPNTSVILETITADGTRTVMAQRYLPDIAKGDKRVLLIDGVAAPYALARIPKPGESRGNLAAGGTGVAQPLSPRDQEIAAAVGPVAREHGLLIVGLDVIGDHLTEVNVTSPTCMREILDQTGFDIPGMVIDALEARPRAA